MFSTVGDIFSTVGVFSTLGDIMSTVGVILSTVGDTQYRGGHLMHVGDIMSTVGMFSTVGVLKLQRMVSPTVQHTHPHGTHDIPQRE